MARFTATESSMPCWWIAWAYAAMMILPELLAWWKERLKS